MKKLIMKLLLISFAMTEMNLALANINAPGELQNAEKKAIILAEITSNIDRFTAHLVLLVNEQDEATGAQINYIDKEDTRPSQYFNVSEFNQNMVLKEVKKGRKTYQAVILKGSNFQQYARTFFSLSYLTNGLTGNRDEVQLTLDYTGNSWGLYLDGEKIRKMYFKKNTIFGKLVGVDKIQFNR